MLAKMEGEGQTVPLGQTPSHWRRNGPNFSRENDWDDPSGSSDFISTLNLTRQYFWGHRGRCWAETLNPSGSGRVAACQHFTVFIFNFTLTKSKAKRLESAEEQKKKLMTSAGHFLFSFLNQLEGLIGPWLTAQTSAWASWLQWLTSVPSTMDRHRHPNSHGTSFFASVIHAACLVSAAPPAVQNVKCHNNRLQRFSELISCQSLEISEVSCSVLHLAPG